MNDSLLFYYLLRLLGKRRSKAQLRLVSRSKKAINRRRAFKRKQLQERSLFIKTLTIKCLMLVFVPRVRLVWVKERSEHWWQHVVSNFTPQDWLENFRVSQVTFTYICNQLRTSITKADTVMRKAITAEKRVAITIWFLATGCDYRTIGHLFGVAKSTVCVVLKEVCACIVNVLLPKYIAMPKGNALKNVIEGFRRDYGFPQCVGAVDGTHIPVVSPEECAADYYNRKGWHSVLMQGTVDNLGRFVDIYVGWPGRVHDARVFANSSLYKRGQDNTLLPDWKEKLGPNNKDVPLVILGDPAYPLLEWLMKAFPDTGHLTQHQRQFNYRLSRARVVVEHSYGKLKGRWRCLMKRLDISVVDVPEVVAACCVLHNICEVHGDSFNSEWAEGINLHTCNISTAALTTTTSNLAVDIRNTLMSYFNQ